MAQVLRLGLSLSQRDWDGCSACSVEGGAEGACRRHLRNKLQAFLKLLEFHIIGSASGAMAQVLRLGRMLSVFRGGRCCDSDGRSACSVEGGAATQTDAQRVP
jgi:hypothetical protein